MTDISTLRKIAHDTLDAAIDAQSEGSYEAALSTLWDATEQARHAVQATRLPPVVPASHDFVWGHCFASFKPTPLEGIKLLTEYLGVNTLRYGARINSAEDFEQHDGLWQRRGPINFSRTDEDFNMFEKAGLDRVIFNVTQLSAWMTKGNPVFEDGALAYWVDPRDGSKGRKDYTIKERPEFFAPFRPDLLDDVPDIMRVLGAACARRYGSSLKEVIVSCWNEWEIRSSNPIYDALSSYVESLRPLYIKVIIPFVEGWRSVHPNARYLGWDNAYPGGLMNGLALETEYLALDPKHPVVDLFGIHVYPAGDVEPDTIERSIFQVTGKDQYRDVIARHPRHAKTPVIVTEYAADMESKIPMPDGSIYYRTSPTVDWTRTLIAAGVNGVCPLVAGRWLLGGIDAWDRHDFKNPDGSWKVNEEAIRMRRLVREENEKRRAVRTL